jgi:hypothetical protein
MTAITDFCHRTISSTLLRIFTTYFSKSYYCTIKVTGDSVWKTNISHFWPIIPFGPDGLHSSLPPLGFSDQLPCTSLYNWAISSTYITALCRNPGVPKCEQSRTQKPQNLHSWNCIILSNSQKVGRLIPNYPLTLQQYLEELTTDL